MEYGKNDLMEKIMHLSMLLRRLSAPKFPHEGVRGQSQQRALTQIALRDGITQRELLEKLGVQPSSMSELLRKLETNGLIERRQSEDDHRQINLYINESGRRFLERVNDDDEQLIPFDALSEEEQAQLGALLDKLISGAQDACADKGLSMFPPRPPREFGAHCPNRDGFGKPPRGEFPHHPNHPPRPHERFEDEFGDRAPEGLNPVERGREFGRGGRPRFGGPVRLPNIHNGSETKPEPVQLADNEPKEKI